MSGKRENYISWETYFMLMALESKDRSKDPRTQVGAVIVKDNQLLSTGYNGTPKGMNDDEMPWDSLGEETGEFIKTKNAFVVHSEANAIIHYRGNIDDLVGSQIYVTLFPCNECAKFIVSCGIKEVYYLKEYKHSDKVLATLIMFQGAGVKVQKIENVTEMKQECLNMLDYLKSIEEEKSFIRKIEYKHKQ